MMALVDLERARREQEAKERSARWNIMSAKAIFAELPPYPWLIKGIHLAPGRITLLNGDADVGKTVIAMSIALAVASGEPLWGVYEVDRPGKVLHLNGEIGVYIGRERYQRQARVMGISWEQLEGKLELSNYPGTRLDDENFEAELRELCAGVTLVIIDSLRAFSGALDEKAKEIGIALLMLARVSEATGATIIVLHHNRKPSKDDVGGAKAAISGSTAILGGSECAYVMFKEKGGPITVKHERSPLGRPLDDFGLKIEDVEKDGDYRWGLRVVHMEGEQMTRLEAAAKKAKEAAEDEKAAEAILATLSRYAGVFRGSKEAFRSACGIGKIPFLRALANLNTEGKVRQDGTYHVPEWHLR